MTHDRSTGTAVGLIVGMLLMGGCGNESSQTGGTGQVLLEPSAGVFTAAALPGKTATLDIVGVRTGIPMTVNSDGSVSATVSEVPVGTWDFRITYRAMSEVIATASGHGTVTANTTTVVSLTTLSFPAAAVAAGSNHSCARLTKKTVSCWGDNSSGQLGNGTTTSSSSPVKVLFLNAVEDVAVEDVAAGSAHSCALLTTGTVWCWGDNSSGQLGDGTTTRQQTPVKVDGLTTATDIAVGRAHSCALLTDKTVKCWGNNSSGQLGHETIEEESLTPDSVTDLDGVKLKGVEAVVAGSDHSCARLTDKTVKCWGNNSSGQLGHETIEEESLTPDSVTDLDGVKLKGVEAVVAGSNHSCARLTTGTVWCWGDNGFGQLGHETFEGKESSPPMAVPVLSGVTDIAAGSNHNCAVLDDTDKTVWCWGDNSSGQLGDDTTTRRLIPVKVKGLTTATDIAAGRDHSCARLDDTDKTVWCWGANGNGQLGNKATLTSASPLAVTGLTTVINVAAGSNHNCAILDDTDKTVWCWGANGFGQLGNGTTTSSSSPVKVPGLTTAIAVVAGSNHNCALLDDKDKKDKKTVVSCWGDNSFGQLGDGTTKRRLTPVKVKGITTATDVAAGRAHSCALLTTRTVRCWGYNNSGRLGDGTTKRRLTPVEVLTKHDGPSLTGVTAVAAGSNHNCARLIIGTVWCWGANGFGRLGDGTTTRRLTPVEVLTKPEDPLTGATAVAAGRAHSCARLNDGSVFCWGQNNAGQLGTGNDTSFKFPMPVFNLTIATDRIAAGSDHSCAPLSSSTVRCWGNNGSGQLGDGTKDESSIPVPVLNLTTATDVAAGSAHSCARLTTGTVFCWGSNSFGQLGSGEILVSPLPVKVVGIS